MFGADLEIAEAQVSALVREDYITVKKDSGDTDLQWGQKSEEYTGISAYGAFIGSGKENFSPINSTEDHPYSTIEPN